MLNRAGGPSPNDDAAKRIQAILAMLCSKSEAGRLAGVEELLAEFIEPLKVFAEGVARKSKGKSLRALWDPINESLDELMFDQVLQIVTQRLKSKAQKEGFPSITNLYGYVIGVFKRCAYDLWRQQLRHQRRFRNSDSLESAPNHRIQEPLDCADFNEFKTLLLEDMREFMRTLSDENRIIFATYLKLVVSPVGKRGRNAILVARVNEAFKEQGIPPMSHSKIVQRCNRLKRRLMQRICERGYYV